MSMVDERATQVRSETLDAVRRRRQGMRAALVELEGAVAAPSAGRVDEWTAAVLRRVTALKEAFDHHVAVTEGPDGLFEEVIAEAPLLANRIAKLRDDHHAIDDALAACFSPGISLDPESQVAVLRDAAVDAMTIVVRHRHAGASLVYEAYFVDIEAAD
jgi:hypothetical protein